MTIRGAVHLHSRYSYDGALSLAEIRELMLVQGCSFALMTEHTDNLDPAAARSFIDECRQLSDAHFCIIPGFEVPYLGTHILVIGASAYHEGPSTETLARWHADGALVVVAHPHRNGYRIDSFLREHIHGIEIWNSQYDGIHAPRTRALELYRTLGIGHAYGSLDLHRAAHRFGPIVEMDVPCDESAILGALRTGSFSISRGSVTIQSNGTIRSANPSMVRVVGTVMPAIIGVLQSGSSLLSRLGLRSFALKKWIRRRV